MLVVAATWGTLLNCHSVEKVENHCSRILGLNRMIL